jgi:hypothetical protein
MHEFTHLPDWFDIKEFNEYLTNNQLDEEVSVQTRIKLARAAKRTAKRRAFLRKARARRRKSGKDLKKRAYREVRSALRRKLYSGDMRKASYAQRARIDAAINRRKGFIGKLVSQIMPRVVKKESQRIQRLSRGKGLKENFVIEQDINPKNERVSARLRKQKQREKEKEIREMDPSKMAMVVRDGNGNLAIVDKDSYESDKHVPIVKPQDMSYSVALRVSQDPSFKRTLTSDRILGTQQTQGEQPQQQSGSSQAQPNQSIAQQQQQLSLPGGQPVMDNTEIDSSNAKWILATTVNMMKGMDIKAQIKAGLITPEQANEYMFSENMQNFGNEIAQKLAKEFISVTGRNINEYELVPVIKEEAQVSDLWIKYGSVNNFPKTDISLIHQCSRGKGACQSMGIEPDEEVVKLNIKFGNSHLIDGKMNGDLRALFETVNTKMQEHLYGGYGSLLGDENTLSEADRYELEKIKKSIFEFKKYLDRTIPNARLSYGTDMLFNRSAITVEEQIESYAEKINSLKIEVQKRLHDTFSNNRTAMKLFYHESLTGKLKFNNTVASSNYLLAIDDESQELKMTELNETFIDEMLDTELFSLDISFKCDHCGTIYEENAWNQTIEYYIQNGMELPKEIDSYRMCGRTTENIKTQQKEQYFRNSSLKVLFEQSEDERKPADPSEQFLAMYYKNYLMEIKKLNDIAKSKESVIGMFFGMFKVSPIGIRTTPIKLFNAIEKRDGIKITNITVDGKQKFIKVMGHPVFNSDTLPEIDDMSESYSFAKRFISEYWVKKNGKRDYKKEYRKYQGKKSQIKKRSKRVLARRKLARKGKVHKGDGKDVDHKDGNPLNNSDSNLRVLSKSENRSRK